MDDTVYRQGLKQDVAKITYVQWGFKMEWMLREVEGNERRKETPNVAKRNNVRVL